MKELFRLKIASKRQVTVPQKLLNLLHLVEGDEIHVEIEDGRIDNVEPCKVVPTSLFTSDVLEQLAAREAQIEEHGGVPVNPEQLVADAVHREKPGAQSARRSPVVARSR